MARRAWSRAWAAGMGLLASAGCTSEGSVSVVVCGDLEVPEHLDAVRVALLDEGLAELRAAVLELTERVAEPRADAAGVDAGLDGEAPPDDEPLDGGASSGGVRVTGELPLAAELPGSGAARWVRAQALLAGVVVATFDRHTGALDDGDEVELRLDGACLRASCSLGQTCVDGECVLAPGPGAAPRCGGAR